MPKHIKAEKKVWTPEMIQNARFKHADRTAAKKAAAVYRKQWKGIIGADADIKNLSTHQHKRHFPIGDLGNKFNFGGRHFLKKAFKTQEALRKLRKYNSAMDRYATLIAGKFEAWNNRVDLTVKDKPVTNTPVVSTPDNGHWVQRIEQRQNGDRYIISELFESSQIN
jgi:hypothetical protein